MKLWPLSSTGSDAANGPQSWTPLRVVSRAMCCSVGYTAPAASAAINARLNHFRETQFVSRGGAPIIGGALFEVDTWGAERLSYMLRSVIAEALAEHIAVDAAQIAILVIGAEPQRPGRPSNCLADALAEILGEARQHGKEFHALSQFCDYGKAGIGKALELASQLLESEGGLEYVLLAAADSLLDAGAVERFLDEERIATESNADGFIPAEGAGAVLLTKVPAATPALWIEGVATAQEDWRLDSDTPLRAQGLTAVIRGAAAAANCQVASLDFHASGMTGESWYAKEVGLALARCMERKKPEFPHLMVVRSVGETGTASPLLTLSWLAGLMANQINPGSAGLLHFAGDDGQRAAMVVRYGPNPRAAG